MTITDKKMIITSPSTLTLDSKKDGVALAGWQQHGLTFSELGSKDCQPHLHYMQKPRSCS